MNGSSTVETSPFAGQAGGYELSSDLSKLCLPSEFTDAHRKLAWVDSICFLFLVVGLVGLKAPKVVERPMTPVADLLPVELPPPEEKPKVVPQILQEEPVQADKPLDTPQVAAVVAAPDTKGVEFAVPVEGAVAVAPARFATPPPPVTQVAAPRKFNPDAEIGGSFPSPSYPVQAWRNRSQGTVTVDILVDATGAVTSAKVIKTSGDALLDQEALKTVKARWHFLPGEDRHYV